MKRFDEFKTYMTYAAFDPRQGSFVMAAARHPFLDRVAPARAPRRKRKD